MLRTKFTATFGTAENSFFLHLENKNKTAQTSAMFRNVFMMRKITRKQRIRSITIVFLIAFVSILCTELQAQSRGGKAAKKREQAEEKKELKKQEQLKLSEQLREQHIKNQDKKTRKRMKKSAKKAKENRRRKPGLFWRKRK